MTGAFRWAALTGLYLVFAGQADVSEIVAGLLAGGTAMTLSLFLRQVAWRRFALGMPWRRLLVGLPCWLVRDSYSLARALVRALAAGHAGGIVRLPFAASTGGAAEAGRKAIAVLLASAAPNGYVLGSGRDSLTLHRLASPQSDPCRVPPT